MYSAYLGGSQNAWVTLFVTLHCDPAHQKARGYHKIAPASDQINKWVPSHNTLNVIWDEDNALQVAQYPVGQAYCQNYSSFQLVLKTVTRDSTALPPIGQATVQ